LGFRNFHPLNDSLNASAESNLLVIGSGWLLVTYVIQMGRGRLALEAYDLAWGTNRTGRNIYDVRHIKVGELAKKRK
jgi:hypothetical protein